MQFTINAGAGGGLGSGTPAIAVNASATDFGTVNIRSKSDLTVTVANTGTAALNVFVDVYFEPAVQHREPGGTVQRECGIVVNDDSAVLAGLYRSAKRNALTNTGAASVTVNLVTSAPFAVAPSTLTHRIEMRDNSVRKNCGKPNP